MSQIYYVRRELQMMEFIQKFIDFINSIIAKIKALVAEIRTRNDA